MGDTVVMANVVGNRNATDNPYFFPLTVDYQERTYAAGKIPGGFFKREGRPSEKETLTCRLIDRPIRPLSRISCFHIRRCRLIHVDNFGLSGNRLGTLQCP